MIVDGVVYIANGQDPEHGEGVGHLYAIDGTKRGDITKTGLLWHMTGSGVPSRRLPFTTAWCFIATFRFVHCVDAKTGNSTGNTTCWPRSGSATVIGGKSISAMMTET